MIGTLKNIQTKCSYRLKEKALDIFLLRKIKIRRGKFNSTSVLKWLFMWLSRRPLVLLSWKRGPEVCASCVACAVMSIHFREEEFQAAWGELDEPQLEGGWERFTETTGVKIYRRYRQVPSASHRNHRTDTALISEAKSSCILLSSECSAVDVFRWF